MKSIKYLVLLLMLAVAGCGQAPVGDEDLSAQGADPQVDVLTFPINLSQFIPCAAGGAGEEVTATGEARVLLRTVVNSQNIMTSFHLNYQGVSGVGSSTGDKYQGSAVIQSHSNTGAGGSSTFMSTVRLVGKGANNNLVVRTQFHLTINNNGELTAIVESNKLECQ